MRYYENANTSGNGSTKKNGGNGQKKDCLPPEELLTLATAISIALTQGLSIKEIDNLSNFFSLLSVQTAAISSQKSYCSGEGTQLIV